MPRQTRMALVMTLQDFLSAFRPALQRLPSSPEILKAQRAVTVLDSSLTEILEKMK